MRFAVVGAGAIGAFVGAMLARAGEEVTLIARGPHLAAMRERGVRVRGSLGEFDAHPTVTSDLTAAASADAVLLAVKAHSVTEIAPRLGPLLGADTSVVTMQNGIPWWYFWRNGGEWEGTQLETVDPGGVIGRSIAPERIIGSVVYCSTIIAEPGLIEHIEGTKFSIGEPSGSRSDRCRRISEAFVRAGLRCPVRGNIRHEIWAKLMGSVAFNPISALTRSTLGEMVACPETRALAGRMMAEAETVARKLGIEIGISAEQRLSGAEKVGEHKTSMLQDVEAGRPLEVEPIVGAVVELGDKLGLPLPTTRSVYSCVKLLAQTLNSSHTKRL